MCRRDVKQTTTICTQNIYQNRNLHTQPQLRKHLFCKNVELFSIFYKNVKKNRQHILFYQKELGKFSRPKTIREKVYSFLMGLVEKIKQGKKFKKEISQPFSKTNATELFSF